jgi:hypothetical protein
VPEAVGSTHEYYVLILLSDLIAQMNSRRARPKLRKVLLMKSILSAVPAPKGNSQSGKDLGRALPIEFVELSRTESYGY